MRKRTCVFLFSSYIQREFYLVYNSFGFMKLQPDKKILAESCLMLDVVYHNNKTGQGKKANE